MRVNSPLYLDSRFRSRFVRLFEDVQVQKCGFRIFESFRSDEEQLRVFNLGTSKARPGESAHNWGLAADYVPYDQHKGWHWPKPSWEGWDILGERALEYELERPIDWDKPHVQVPDWRALRSVPEQLAARRMYVKRAG